MHVLVTGAFGWTAQPILEAIRKFGYEITTFDLMTVEWGEHINRLATNVILGSVAEFDAVNKAMRDVDVVVHLAVAAGEGDYSTPDAPFSTNVMGTYNVYEAARRHKVRKVVLMSEAAVHVPHPGEDVVETNGILHTTNNNPREHLYDLTKRLQETIAHDYAMTYGMTSIVLRPGHIVDSRQEVDAKGMALQYLQYLRGGWVCRYDVATAVLKAVQLKFEEPYSVFHVIGSEEAWQRFDVEYTEHELEMMISARFEAFR